ncbi:MAG: 50S ribosomal protein L11 methyltransferase [Ekhidna sp.]|nr:50S ribosomal protein L11 methyltransferase [Ekhidna sp.]
MDFVTIKVICPQELTDYLISELFQLGFNSFQELNDGFEGSCDAVSFDEGNVNQMLSPFSNLSFQVEKQNKVNWNKKWEKNHDPVIIKDKCIVRASFHSPRPEFEYEIIITPKMSFGTGHHATTFQLLSYQMQLDHREKRVLDVGTGTGILSIMAQQRGASLIVATDTDSWCIENSRKNFELNGTRVAKLFKGQIEELPDSNFDIIMANINKNVLLKQMSEYAEKLTMGGCLLISGFYKEDMDDLKTSAGSHSLKISGFTTKDNWAMLVFYKQPY